MIRNKVALIALSALALAQGKPVDAAPNLVTNGDFESFTPGSVSGHPNGDFQYSPVTGWTSPALDPQLTTTGNLLFTPGSADTTGSYYNNTGIFPGAAIFTLWGPNNGSPNGLPATSPSGGNFVGLDADPQYSEPISQLISGLTPGQAYQLSFWWAGAQLSTTSGPTTEQVQVGFGGQTQLTAVLSNASQGFTGWKFKTFTFTADGPSDTLSFMAVGTPVGLPPFVLLDGVTLSAVPEPSALMLVSLGLVGIGIVRRLRGRAASAAA